MDRKEFFVGQGNQSRIVTGIRTVNGIIGFEGLWVDPLGALVYELDFFGLVFLEQVTRPPPVSIRASIEDNIVLVGLLFVW